MQIVTFFCFAQRDVLLRSAQSPKPSPGNAGPAHLWIDVGRSGARGEEGRGGTIKIGGWGGPIAACDRNTIF
jgi:hypothetical protein